jgi:hypothetical protein
VNTVNICKIRSRGVMVKKFTLTNNENSILKILTIGMLILAVYDWDYAYYQILRILTSAVCGYNAYLTFSDNKRGWAWVCLAIQNCNF